MHTHPDRTGPDVTTSTRGSLSGRSPQLEVLGPGTVPLLKVGPADASCQLPPPALGAGPGGLSWYGPILSESRLRAPAGVHDSGFLHSRNAGGGGGHWLRARPNVHEAPGKQVSPTLPLPWPEACTTEGSSWCVWTQSVAILFAPRGVCP